MATTTGKIMGAMTLGAIFWFARRTRADDTTKTEHHAAAFADNETDPDGFAQTRGAGPAAMRDATKDEWDRVDQAVDESFPASDPPSF